MTNTLATLTLDQAQEQDWDVLIIGAGMGGGLLGRHLAEGGLRVLYVEKGVAGRMTEQPTAITDIANPTARALRGIWPKPMEFRKDGVSTRFFGPYGSGVGGSSVFYAAALERPERHDLDETTGLPHPTGGWPIGFDAFAPYIDQATSLLHLSGTPDPLASGPAPDLSPPGPMPQGDATLMEEMQRHGLHPYRLHLALRYPQECRNCGGSKCPFGCKMDGRSAGVVPALATGRAGLLVNCAALEVLDDGTAVSGIKVEQNGKQAVLRARSYALCGGSFGSAQLLLKSTSCHDHGCANSSGWVGRGLMFHIDELFVLWPRTRQGSREKFGKSIGLRDLYSVGKDRFGLVQSVGFGISYESLVFYFNRLFDQSALRRWPRLKAFTRFPAVIAARMFGDAAVFVGMMEDFPYPENRVILNKEDPDILTFEYTFHDELLARRKRFRKALMRAFRKHRRFMVSLQPVLNFGHPLGTLRFGTDPATSVLRPDCRSHDLNNLYVADGSFMPSAMGVNPSLMIAANALRVGDVILQQHKRMT